jgi:hypothetical protein
MKGLNHTGVALSLGSEDDLPYSDEVLNHTGSGSQPTEEDLPLYSMKGLNHTKWIFSLTKTEIFRTAMKDHTT